MVEIRFLCNVIDTRALIGPCSHMTSRCCQSVTPGMSLALHSTAYSNWSLATYPFFSSSKIFDNNSCVVLQDLGDFGIAPRQVTTRDIFGAGGKKRKAHEEVDRIIPGAPPLKDLVVPAK